MISDEKIKSVQSLSSWRKALHHHRNLMIYSLGAVFIVLATALALGARFSEFSQIVPILYVPLIGTMMFFGVMLAYYAICSVIHAIQTGSEIGKTFDKKVSSFVSDDLFTQGVIGTIPMLLATIAFDVSKSLIGYINPYKWDPLFSSVDKAFHFGFYPHALFMPLIERIDLLETLNVAYISWFFVMFLVSALCLFCDRNAERRKTYLWSVVLVWTIGGTICATIFSSVGPIFFHDFYPHLADPYKDLIVFLREKDANGSPISAISLSHLLLEMSRNERVIDVNGPSAMPSMHIAAAWVMVLYGFAVNIRVGIAAFIYFILLFLGSVCMAWHYAIDGYASIILVSFIWIVSGWCVRRNSLQ